VCLNALFFYSPSLFKTSCMPHLSIRRTTALVLSFFMIVQTAFAQNIGIGTATPAASAQLDVVSTTKGVLIPRVTTAQMNAIASPATGLLVYNTTASAFAYRTTSGWVFLTGNTNAGAGWSTLGNAGTNAATNFIGTTDDIDLVFKRNNIRAGVIGINNTSYGNQALNPAATGISNTAYGAGALTANVSGSFNTSSGAASLLVNDTGSSNTANGYQALRFNKGSSNTAIGMNALLFNNAGNNNTATGVGALSSNSTGFSNVAIGINALNKNTNRSNLVAIGDSALFNNGTGASAPEHATGNTAIGSKALYSNTNGNENTAVGFASLKNNNTGSANTAMGWNSMGLGTGGIGNSAFGYRALLVNNGLRNVAMGLDALSINATGSYNTAVGYGAMSGNSASSNNTAVGYQAGILNEGSSNVFLGYKAGQYEAGSNKLYISNDETNAANTLIYGEFDNKILSIGGRLGIGTITPAGLLHLKNANTDANASQLIIEGNSDYGNSTVSAMEFRSNFTSGNSGPSGRIKSFYTSNNFTDAKTTFQTIAPGPAFVDVMTLTNGRVGIGTTTPTTARLVINTLQGETGIDLASSDSYAEMRVIRNSLFGPDKDLYLGYGSPAGSGVRLYSDGLETVTIRNNLTGIGKIPLTSSNDSRLQVKQQSNQNGIGIEAANTTNHWDFFATNGPAANLSLWYNGAFKGSFDNVLGTYTAASDRRMKKDITVYRPVLNNLMQLLAYQYHYLDNKGTDPLSTGFMAQDVQKLFPEAVSEMDMKNGEKLLGINYQYFTVVAIKGLQEQQEMIEELEKSKEEQGLKIARQEEKNAVQEESIKKQEDRIAKLEALIKTISEKK
jgi:hypothetical protein